MEFSRNTGRKRYEVHIDGKLAGFAEYIEMSGLAIFSHTEDYPRYTTHRNDRGWT